MEATAVRVGMVAMLLIRIIMTMQMEGVAEAVEVEEAAEG